MNTAPVNACFGPDSETERTVMHAEAMPGPTVTACSPARRAKFDRLVAPRRDGLLRFARWLAGDRDVADDLVQETLMRAWRAIDTLERPAAVMGWLLTILRREHSRHVAATRRLCTRVPLETLADPRSGRENATEAVVLRNALRTLPQEHREPLLMQVLGGYSLGEIAAELGLTAAGAGSRVFRVRLRLRGLLGDPE